MALTFSDELAAFRARTPDPGFAALIILATENHNITAGLLLGTLDIPRVAFLTTPETTGFPQYIAGLIGVDAEQWHCSPGDHRDITQVYRSVKALREQWAEIADPTLIAADLTGGQKPMSVGLEKAAHMLGLTTIYVESEYWPKESGKRGPIPATQRLVIPPNPYLVFGDIEAAEAKRLYQTHDYAGAQRIFTTLSHRVPGEDGQRYAIWENLAALYAAWDVLDLQTAIAHAQSLPLESDLLAPHQATLEAQCALLKQLETMVTVVIGRDDAALQTLADPAAVLALLGSLHTSALRRAAQGRYDFAALFRYRCLELISQHRLATYGILTNSPTYDQLELPIDANAQQTKRGALSQLFQAQQRLVGRKQPAGLPKNSITLFDGYLILAALSDPLVRDFDLKEIELRTKARNLSVLAHGYNLIGEVEYNYFAEVVDLVIDRLFTTGLSQSRAEWEATVRFVNPFAE